MKAESENHHSQWTSMNGRPVSELNAERELIVSAMNDGILMRKMRTQLKDSRKDGWTNQDALEDMRGRFPELLRFLAGVNTKYFGENCPTEIDTQDAIALAQICVAMPGYLIARQGYDTTGEIPDIVADAFKVNAGLHAAFNYFDVVTETEGDRPFEAKSIYTLMNEHDLLRNVERVCPAPAPMIIRSIDALVMRQGATPDIEMVDRLFPNFADLVAFSEVETSLDFLSKPSEEF